MATLPPGRWILLAVLGLGLGLAPVARATPVSIHFEGAVTALEPTQAPLLVPGVAVDDPISAVVTFDDAAAGPAGGVYASTGAPYGIEVQIGSLSLVSADLVNILVRNDCPLPPGVTLSDSYQAFAALESPVLVLNDALSIGAFDYTGQALTSDVLPLEAAALSGFASFYFAYQIPGSGGPIPTPITVVQGSLQPVPEPARLVSIAMAGLCGVALRRRRR